MPEELFLKFSTWDILLVKMFFQFTFNCLYVQICTHSGLFIMYVYAAVGATNITYLSVEKDIICKHILLSLWPVKWHQLSRDCM